MSEHLNRRVSKLEDKVRHLERSNTPGKQDEAGVTPQNAAHNENDSAKRKFGHSFEIPPAPADTEKSRKPWYKSLEGWKTVVEIIAIPFAVGYAIVTYYQWQDLRKNFIVDERAWIGIKSVILSGGEVGKTIIVAVNVTNSGKTPATDLHLAEITAGYSETDRSLSAMNKGTHAVAPGTDDAFYIDLPIPDSMIKGLVARTSRIYVRGRFEYKDIFGDTHPTEFCTYYPSPVNLTNFFNCPNGGGGMK